MSHQVGEKPGLMKPPGMHRSQFIPLKFVSRGLRRRSGLGAELNLTPFVDLLLVLVVFLLPDFSPSAELLCPCRHVPLPQGLHFRDLESAPVVSISTDAVTLNGDPKAYTPELLGDFALREMLLPLYEDLVVLKNNYKLLHPEPHPWPGTILLQADKNLAFGVLNKVMSTCSAAGYGNVHLVIEHTM